MSLSSLLRQSNSEALSLSQQTAQYLQKHASTGTSRIPIPILTYPESTETWVMYEKLFLSSLRTGDDKAAFNCLEKLMNRFGATNERIMGLRGLYQEAVAKDDAALERVLQEYDEILAEDSVNTVGVPETLCLPWSKLICTSVASSETSDRTSSESVEDHWGNWCSGRATRVITNGHRSMDWTLRSVLSTKSVSSSNLLPRRSSASGAQCLECNITSFTMWLKARWTYCCQIHAHLGEVLYLSAMNGNENSEDRILAEATRRFCRSVELCDDYLRGYYGLKLVWYWPGSCISSIGLTRIFRRQTDCFPSFPTTPNRENRWRLSIMANFECFRLRSSENWMSKPPSNSLRSPGRATVATMLPRSFLPKTCSIGALKVGSDEPLHDWTRPYRTECT